MSSAYGQEYYEHSCGLPYKREQPEWLSFFGHMADEIVSCIAPRRVLDIGCAKGFLVESLRDRGVKAFGFDISEYAIGEVRPDIREFCWLGDLKDPIKEDYDLVTCIEVLEHVPEADARLGIRHMAAHAGAVLFSSTPSDFQERTHVNVHPVRYWLEEFREAGFAPDLTFDAGFIAPHAILFRKSAARTADDVLALYAYSRDLASALSAARNEAEKKSKLWAEALQQSERALEEARQGKPITPKLLRAEIERLDESRAEAEEQTSTLRARLTAVQAEVHRLSEKKQELEQRLGDAEDQARALRHSLEELQQHVSNLESSFGWRLVRAFRNQRERYFPSGTRRRTAVDWGLKGVKFSYIHGISGLHRRVSRRNALSGEQPARAYQDWVELNEPKPQDLEKMRESAATFAYQPLISILTPVYNTKADELRACLESVRNQVYPKWELCLWDDASTDQRVRKVLQEYQARDERIKVRHAETNQGISLASNGALSLATGEFIGLLDHDDVLSPNALFEVVQLLQTRGDADVIYSDEDKLERNGRRSEPYFKPDWSPELLRSTMYTCHFSVYRKSVVDQLGGFRQGFEGSQDYDLMLRVSERTQRILHISKVLYHWRKTAGSAAESTSAKSFAYLAARRALTEHLQRRGISGEVVAGRWPGFFRVRYAIKPERVSIVIPTRDKLEVLRKSIESIEGKTEYPDYEIIVVDNNSSEPETRAYLASLKHKVLEFQRPFNFSRICNYGAAHGSGRYLLFLNNDTEVISRDWIRSLVELGQQPEIGIVGAKLLYPDGTIQHLGVTVGLGGVAGHPLAGFDADSPHYFGLTGVIRNCSAVTAACMLVRREVFEQVGGFDEDMPVAFNDVDFCLRVLRAGYRIAVTPYCLLYHHESASRGYALDPADIAFMAKRWGAALLSDPYYNPNLTLHTGDYGLRF